MAYEDDARHLLDRKIDLITDDSLAATRRIRQVTEETHHMGVDTLITLNDQGEQLDNIEQRLDEINVDLKKSDKSMKELEKCCGCCVCNLSASKASAYRRLYDSVPDMPEENENRHSVVTEQPTAGGGRGPGQGPFIKRVTNDVREDEMEDNLQAVSGALTQLKGMAVDMGGELDRQCSQLDRINKKADINTAHLSQTNFRIRRQL